MRCLIVFIIKALPLAYYPTNKNGSAAFLKPFSLEVLGNAQHSFWETLRKMTKKAISFRLILVFQTATYSQVYNANCIKAFISLKHPLYTIKLE